MIFKSYRDFLYSRDLTGIAFLYFIFYTSLAIYTSKGFNSVWEIRALSCDAIKTRLLFSYLYLLELILSLKIVTFWFILYI